MKLTSEALQKLGKDSWVVIEDSLEPALLEQLKAQAVTAYNLGQFRSAKVGRSQEQVLSPAVRSDSVLWLDFESPVQRQLAGALESLRLEINQTLFLGLQTFEAHFACYDPGQAYAAHFDQPRLISPLHGERVLSFVIYLNEQWDPLSGGELCLHLESEIRKIEPLWNRMALFLSQEILHSVQAAKRPRWTLTGWYRRT